MKSYYDMTPREYGKFLGSYAAVLLSLAQDSTFRSLPDNFLVNNTFKKMYPDLNLFWNMKNLLSIRAKKEVLMYEIHNFDASTYCNLNQNSTIYAAKFSEAVQYISITGYGFRCLNVEDAPDSDVAEFIMALRQSLLDGTKHMSKENTSIAIKVDSLCRAIGLPSPIVYIDTGEYGLK